ncbi:MAG: helix-turn-helix transcriptional regulator [Candidatus Obscuribacterales bacterium]|nr:helix-turn-helix transcriptional regulator [Candidatus Obscuribacterales bacterium]
MDTDHLDEFMKGLGRLVLRRRKELGLSQTDLASKAGLHRTYISDVENGKRNFSLGTLYSLSSTLKISMTQLITQAQESVCDTSSVGTAFADQD